MEDYTLEIIDKDEQIKQRKIFILKYEIINTKNNLKKIKIYYANGNKIICNYTKELEETLLQCMKDNINNYKDIMELNTTRKRARDYFSEAVILFGKLLIFPPILSGIIFHFSILSLVIMLLAGIVLSSGLIYRKIYTKRYDDYQKNVLFLENEDKINQQFLDNDNSNICIYYENKNIVTKPNGKMGYTINSIDKMSLKELKTILEQIKGKEQDRVKINESERVMRKSLIR